MLDKECPSEALGVIEDFQGEMELELDSKGWEGFGETNEWNVFSTIGVVGQD